MLENFFKNKKADFAIEINKALSEKINEKFDSMRDIFGNYYFDVPINEAEFIVDIQYPDGSVQEGMRIQGVGEEDIKSKVDKMLGGEKKGYKILNIKIDESCSITNQVKPQEVVKQNVKQSRKNRLVDKIKDAIKNIKKNKEDKE